MNHRRDPSPGPSHSLPTQQALFEKWLHRKLAGVIHAAKPGELLILRAGNLRFSLDEGVEFLAKECGRIGVFHRILTSNSHLVRVFVFHPGRVQRSLDRVPHQVFVACRYSGRLDPDSFLDEIGRRWLENDRSPAEIGMVLGYPLKDVLGFLGLSALPASGYCGWRIYGDPLPSLARKRAFARARERAEAFLSQ